MRIRKNGGNKRAVIQGAAGLICQLNRPPWEDDSFFTQGDWDNNLPVNDSSSDDEIVTSGSEESMDISFESREKTPALSVELKNDVAIGDGGGGGGGRDGGGDGGGGGVVEIGGLMLPPSYLPRDLSPAPLPPKKVVGPPSTVPLVPKKRGRPKKSASRVSNGNNYYSGNPSYYSSNPSEYYYYEGFGPSKSKRRGGGETNCDPGPQVNNGNGYGYGYGCGYLPITKESNSMSEDDVIMDNGENKNINTKNSNNGGVIESFDSVLDAERELDYIHDDEDEEEMYGGKRARKPIKARSLKSLM